MGLVRSNEGAPWWWVGGVEDVMLLVQGLWFGVLAPLRVPPFSLVCR